MKLALREEAFGFLGEGAPDFMRLAVAHLAAMHATDAGGPVVLDGSSEETGAAVSLASGPAPGGTPPVVLPTGALLSEELRVRALELRAAGRAAVPVLEAGSVTWVGPVLEPAGGPCILCVQRAVAPNRQTEVLLGETGVDPVARPRLEALGLAWWRKGIPALADSILELDGVGGLAARHQVRRFHDCPVCGAGSADRNAAPPRLRPLLTHPSSDTGSRVSEPEEVWRRFGHLTSPLTGAVRHVREVEAGAPGLIHVFTAGHAVRMGSASLRQFMRDGRDASGGKGSSREQARASALCEALERFSSVFRGDEVDALGPRSSVKGALDPTAFLLFSESQLQGRVAWNRKVTSGFQKVPEPFDEASEVAWSRVWSLGSGAEAFVPTSLLYMGFQGPGSTFCNADTNGVAAGQTEEEAVLQGLLEVVERDAVGLWWYNRTQHSVVDVPSFGDAYVERVFEHYASIGRKAWVLDLTSDLGIPVLVALSARVDGGAPEVIFGFGAHLDPRIALRRCVTEMNQMLATVRRPPEERQGLLRGEFDDALDWWAHATLDGHPYLLPSEGTVGLRDLSGVHAPGADLRDDILRCVSIVRRHGKEVWVRDMTRPDLGLPVLKVLVPGLRHFWRRLAPGRLYEVPVALGRLKAPLAEAELNPVSLFV